ILSFSVSKSCSTCSRVFARDIHGDHAVLCAGIIGIKNRHNVVHDTLVNICFRSGISAGKEVTIGLDGDFVSGRAVIDAAQRKRVKYMAKCAAIGNGFLPIFFLFFGEIRGGRGYIVEADEVSTSSSSSGSALLGDTPVVCCLELWHACAGPLISLPKKGNPVVYCPQGHLEQLQFAGEFRNSGEFSVAPHVFCRVVDVKLHAEAGNDDVYAQVSLIQDPQI
ncbi:hypothetical protein Tco_1391052, partial [Tanacetum coccineum]